MVHINLAVALGGPKKYELLKVGDVIGRNKDRHHIVNIVQSNQVAMQNNEGDGIWQRGFTGVAKTWAITHQEAMSLIGHIENYVRITEGGTETPLSDIYAEHEKVEVGVGTWLLSNGGELFVGMNCYNAPYHIQFARCTSYGMFDNRQSRLVANTNAVSLADLEDLLPVSPACCTIIPESEALQQLTAWAKERLGVEEVEERRYCRDCFTEPNCRAAGGAACDNWTPKQDQAEKNCHTCGAFGMHDTAKCHGRILNDGPCDEWTPREKE